MDEDDILFLFLYICVFLAFYSLTSLSFDIFNRLID